jgi:hypothetical protein
MLSTNRSTTDADAALAEPIPLSRNYAWADVTPATAVVETVADAIDLDPIDLDPLHEAVDTDALNRVVQPDQSETPGSLRVSFSYHDFFVVVRQTGRVTLYDLEE